MQSHEYRVVPAPRQGLKAKGARSAEERFARAIEGEMNRLAREGWEFVRSDTLPSERREGLFGRNATVPQTVLVFRRPFLRERDPALPPVAAPAMPALALGDAPSVAPGAPMPQAPAPGAALVAGPRPAAWPEAQPGPRPEPRLAAE